MALVKLTSKGQMTLPQEIRARFGLEAGDRLFVEIEDGRIVLTPKTLRIADLVGILPKPRRAVSVEEMNDTIAEEASKHGS
ncbi:MAG: AbrB/MazE/SpoVT family DNA-binding domain-containing protein [bacterium]|nr:AbrB/MazE/SpoVT family DNA-binding domain-containing protein [bacterium]